MSDQQEFTPKDRPGFADGKAPETDSAGDGKNSDTTAAEGPEGNHDEGAADQAFQLPKIDFSTFVFSLNQSVLMHLGVLGDPNSGKKSKNLPLAKQTIDLLGMLQEKTRGNLTGDEENMLKNILYDLRILYVREKA